MDNVVIGGLQLDEDEKYLAKLEAGLYTLQVSCSFYNGLLDSYVSSVSCSLFWAVLYIFVKVCFTFFIFPCDLTLLSAVLHLF